MIMLSDLPSLQLLTSDTAPSRKHRAAACLTQAKSLLHPTPRPSTFSTSPPSGILYSHNLNLAAASFDPSQLKVPWQPASTSAHHRRSTTTSGRSR